MKKNLSTEDRIIRFVLFDLLIGVSLSGMDVGVVVANIVFILAIYVLATLIIGYSPIYHLLRINTIPKKSISD